MAGIGLEAVRGNVTSAVQRMSATQRLTLGLAFVATVAGMFTVSRLTGGTTMATLYAGLEPKTAAAVVEQLDAQAVPYELVDGGQVIKVPAEQVDSLRIGLSAQGLPDSGEGWSILDNQGITTSQFDQRVGYQRAMEGELARTIRAIDGVTDANVHLVIPKDDLFVADNVKPSASVLLVTKGDQALSPMQVQAIVNLVSSAVEGMTPAEVSVTDQSGRILAAPGDSEGAQSMEGDSQLRAKEKYEKDVKTDLESLLSTVVGPGLAVVNVAADLDFDSVQTTSEQYEPIQGTDGAQAILNQTSRNERYRDANGATEAGVLGVETPTTVAATTATTTNTGGTAVNDPNVKYSLDERDASYAMNKVVTTSQRAPGAIRSLSVAVLLDEKAIDPARLAEIQSLVSAAAGIDTNRGDTLAVSLLPINETVRSTIDASNTPAEVTPAGLDLVGLLRTIGTVVVALVVILFGLRSLKGGKRKVVESVSLTELEGGVPALGAGARTDDGVGAIDPPEVRLQNLIANQPDDVAGVLRTWLNEAEVVR
jgi:flagellar M-ring protein FliF